MGHIGAVGPNFDLTVHVTAALKSSANGAAIPARGNVGTAPVLDLRAELSEGDLSVIHGERVCNERIKRSQRK